MPRPRSSIISPDVLLKDAALARTELLKYSSKITMTAHRDPEQRFYLADGNWDLFGKDDYCGCPQRHEDATPLCSPIDLD